MRVKRERGAALVLIVILGAGLMVLSAISLDMALVRSAATRGQREDFIARQIAESAAAHALARIKEGGLLSPKSANGTAAGWVRFADGDYYYETSYDPTTEISEIRAWGRLAVDEKTSGSNVAPDDPLWDGEGWLVRGVEITVKSSAFVPEFPLYFGNGGIERPLGGFEWSGGTDLADPGTWDQVTSNPSSSQTSDVPFEVSALDHPIDLLASGGLPAPSSGYPHPYQIWAAQNPIGQFNIEAWFKNSAGSGDPTSTVDPPPVSSYFDTADPSSPDYPYPVRSDIPDVQDWASALWNKHKDSTDPRVHMLSGGNLSGTHGSLLNPGVTFVTGDLHVPAGKTFEGTGILVIRDDYDPQFSRNNTPSTKASMSIEGTLKWTGLVIVAGWAPSVTVQPPGSVDIVGAFFGEDSVQSGGEISLDSATIILNLKSRFRVRYSNALFRAGGLLHGDLPNVQRQIVGIREIVAKPQLKLIEVVEDVASNL